MIVKSKLSGFFISCFVFLYVFSISCNRSAPVYVISKEDSLKRSLAKTADGIVLVPPQIRYAAYNIIIDSNNYCYFYSLPEVQQATGVYDEEEPELIGLEPNELFKIPPDMEKAFIEANVLSQKSSRSTKSLILASLTDTLQGDFLKDIKTLASDSSNKFSVTIRRARPEEIDVLNHKKAGTYYEPKN